MTSIRHRFAKPLTTGICLLFCLGSLVGNSSTRDKISAGGDEAITTGLPSSTAYETAFYVSPEGDDGNSGERDEPLRTLEEALERMIGSKRKGTPTLLIRGERDKTLAQKEQRYIILRGGVYELEDTLIFDSPRYSGITFKAFPGEEPVLSGGRRLSNDWNVEKVNGRTAWTQFIPDVASGDWYFRQLWVNGERATVPVLPKDGGFLQIEDLVIPADARSEPQPWTKAARDQFIYGNGDISESWHAIDDVWIMASYSWFHGYFKIAGIDSNERVVTLDKPSDTRHLLIAHPLHGNVLNAGHETGLDPNQFYEPAYYRIHNVFEALTEPGEFYLDRASGKLFYLPRPGESPSTALVVAPKLNQILVVKGAGKIESLNFEGISFSHSTILPENHKGTGNNSQSSGDAAVDVYGLSDSKFIDCAFSHLGEFALGLSAGSRDIDVIGNHFHDLGSGAVKTYGAFGNRLDAAAITPLTTMRLRITDNVFEKGGRFFPGQTALNFNKVRNSIFAFNEVSDFFFTGVHFGARWGRDLDFSIVDNQILNNHIHNLGQGHWTANDMGGIYINGVGLGVDVIGNVVHGINCSIYGGNGIYLDQQPCYVRIENNLVYDTNYEGIHLKGFLNEVRNNIVYDVVKAVGQPVAMGFDEPVAIIENNILAPVTSAVFHSKSMSPEDIRFVVRDNLVWSLEAGGDLEVKQSGFIGRDTYKAMGLASWERTTDQSQGRGNLIAPVTFDSLEPGNWKLSEDTLRNAEKIGFKSFEITAGPRPVSQRTLLAFKDDNAALDSGMFQDHLGRVLPEQELEKARAAEKKDNAHMHVQ